MVVAVVAAAAAAVGVGTTAMDREGEDLSPETICPEVESIDC